MIVVVHFTTCCLCQQVTSLVVLGKRYLRSWRSLPPPPWSCFPCHRCPGRPPGEVRRSEGAAFLLNLAVSCSSFSCQINFSLKLAALPLQALLSQLSLSKGLLLCYLLLSFLFKAALCPMDNPLTWRTHGRDGEEVLGARSLGLSRSQQIAHLSLLEWWRLGC